MKSESRGTRFLVLGLVVLSLIAIRAGEVKAVDEFYYEFTVPVQMKGLLPQIMEIIVFASVYDKDNQHLGTWKKLVAVPDNGMLTQDVVVGGTLTPYEDIYAAVKYKIELRLRQEGGAAFPPNTDESNAMWFKSRSNTELVTQIEGDLPELPTLQISPDAAALFKQQVTT